MMNDSFVSTAKANKHETWQILFNALLFQCLWFSIMVFEHVGLVVFLGALLGQFLYRRYVSQTKVTIMLPLTVFVIGLCVDISFTAIGFFSFPSHALSPSIVDSRLFYIPLWLVVMWLGFVLTLQHSLQWVRARRYVCVLVFAIAGPISYMAGQKFGMIQFNDEVILYLILSWGLVGWVASQPVVDKLEG